ncbi:MAG: 50S ribosomal protein L17 [Candidatus Marinimicrobia bacterium]|nr:50S ribosomal protein L17 [Candidatus Neomarinimicrobiota bacterium]|tara:strand:- start:38083 stop:38520 length:438 start_codon:yes stop_codon:yes gene_type:complete
MRHLKKGRKLNRTASHRKALMSNMACSLIKHKHITTTLPKAKEVQKYVERLVTYAKKNNVHGRRLILKKVKGSYKKEIANTLIHEIAPNYESRSGGYTRIIKVGNRKNDDAKVSILEFVDFKSSEQADSNDESPKKVSEKTEDKK